MSLTKVPSLVNAVADALMAAGVDDREARFMSRGLVAYRLGLQPKQLIMHMEDKLEAELLRDDINKLCAGVPLQHVIGETCFMGLTFKCSPAAHIPRMDSEPLVEAAIELMKTHPAPIIGDACCGGGTYGLTLARFLPRSQVALCDLSTAALELCRENARLLEVEERCGFGLGDLFKPLLEANISCDLLTVNPPYVASEQIDSLPPQVRRDPRASLDGGSDGLFFYRRIAKEAASVLAPQGWLLLEHGDEQQDGICRMLEQQGWEICVKMQDYGHRDRGLLARRRG